jgi:hypothetical protein
MWLIKGIVLGVMLFVIGFFVYAFAFARRTRIPPPQYRQNEGGVYER